MSPILDALANRYCAPHWVFMSEFRNANGFDSSRSADALAFGLYGSRGYALTGFEVKTARSDWLRELIRRAREGLRELIPEKYRESAWREPA